MDSEKTILYASCLMLDIAKADQKITNDEINITKEILMDYFKISEKKATAKINESYKELEKSIDIFKYTNFLNSKFDYEDKIDLIRCIFEIGYSDGNLHYMELHYIKKIAKLLNIESIDIVKAKIEARKD